MFCASISHNGSGGVPGDRGAPLFLSRRAHLLTTRAAGGGMASGQRALCEADCALCGERQPILPGLRSQSSLAVRRDRYAVPFACENLPPAALSQRQGESKMIALLSLLRKRNRKIGGENDWQFTIWKRRSSAEARAAPPAQPRPI